MNIRRFTVAVATALLLSAGSAQARWLKAETDRFIIYGDVDAATATAYARKLDTVDQLLRFYNPGADTRPPVRKFEVYLVKQHSGLARIAPKIPDAVAGFYSTNAQAEFAVASLNAEGLSGDDVLFHEYAHHFMFANFPGAYPPWFVEGWAEYFGNTDVAPQGVKVGGYNQNRVDWLALAPLIRWDDLLNKRIDQLPDYNVPQYYPQSWFFVHYMMSDKTRAAQLNQAISAVAKGAEPAKAVHEATKTTTAQLESQLNATLATRKLKTLTFPNLASKAKVDVSPLPDSAGDFMLDRLRLALSDPAKPDAGFLAGVRRRAANYPGDPLAEQVLALAEFTYGDVSTGEAIMNKWLAAHPDDVEALRIAGVGQILAGQRDPKTLADRYRAARPFLIKAYMKDGSDFRTLYAYTLTRTIESNYPNDNDVNALLEAQGLAPSAADIALVTGDALLRVGRTKEARQLLEVLSKNPHGGNDAKRARALLEGGPRLDLTKVTLIRATPEDPKKPS